MSRLVFYPYKMGSQSCKAIVDAFKAQGQEVLKVYPDRKYRPRDSDFIINWGNSTAPVWGSSDLNHEISVGKATNKLTCLKQLTRAGVPVPYFFDNRNSVLQYWDILGTEDIPMFARTILTGHSGEGIVIARNPSELVEAPLYTAGFHKTHEYRVHVFNGEVLDFQEKKKRNGTGGRESSMIWNADNDYVFCREGVEVPEYVQEVAIKAVEALNLNFGAVDIGWKEGRGECVVFEVNTAPGLTGTTLQKYVEKIQTYL